MKNLFTKKAGVGTICASDTQVNGIYYDFDKTTQTATVTYRGDSFDSYDNEYSGAVIIPSSVSYDGITYSVTTIGNEAFYKCSSLTSVTIPNSVTSIGEWAFWGCSSLTSVTINSDAILNKDYSSADNLKKIFASQVTEYIIGPTVKGIGKYAFYECSDLTSVTIGNCMTSIGWGAFSCCERLTSVVCYAQYPPMLVLESDVFAPKTYKGTLRVPCDALEAYKADILWGQFTNIVCIEDEIAD